MQTLNGKYKLFSYLLFASYTIFHVAGTLFTGDQMMTRQKHSLHLILRTFLASYLRM